MIFASLASAKETKNASNQKRSLGLEASLYGASLGVPLVSGSTVGSGLFTPAISYDSSSALLAGAALGSAGSLSSGVSTVFDSGSVGGISTGVGSGIGSGLVSGVTSGLGSGFGSGVVSGVSSGLGTGIGSGIVSGVGSGLVSDVSVSSLGASGISFFFSQYPLIYTFY